MPRWSKPWWWPCSTYRKVFVRSVVLVEKAAFPPTKNIICFPQELLEVKQLQEFFSNVAPHDVVNVALNESGSELPLLRRARLLERVENVFLAQIEGFDAPQVVDQQQLRQRVSLPWKPKDLRDHLIIFRRRNATKEE